MILTSTINFSQQTGVHGRIVYIGAEIRSHVFSGLHAGFDLDETLLDIRSVEQYLNEQSLLTLPEILLVEADSDGLWVDLVKTMKKNSLLHGMIIIVLSTFHNPRWKSQALALKVHDFYVYPFPVTDLFERLNFLVKFKLIRPRLTELSANVDVTYKIPVLKRVFDVVASGLALVTLSPLLLLIGLLIRLESKGPVIYKSKRVGTGYKIFDFYKFRSMRVNADKQIEQLSDLNQYGSGEKGKAAFVKIKDDPRVTRFGAFLRKTSLDELPQLFNVLIGDMSMVGNRPLPLYEAEMLTSNEWTTRFLGPAGLTGLWQISRRGKTEMSERERKKLDNFYASRHSFWLDMKILFATLPAMLQKEKA